MGQAYFAELRSIPTLTLPNTWVSADFIQRVLEMRDNPVRALFPFLESFLIVKGAHVDQSVWYVLVCTNFNLDTDSRWLNFLFSISFFLIRLSTSVPGKNVSIKVWQRYDNLLTRS